MNLLQTLTALLSDLLPVETGLFSDTAPEQYLVLTPLADSFAVHADNTPQAEVQEVRLSLFAQGNYLAIKNQIVRRLLDAELTITDRRYLGHEDTTGYHQYAIDVAKEYEWEE